MYVRTDSGMPSPQATPRFLAFIQMTMVCRMVTNLLFSAPSGSSALVYRSACSHAVTKSTHLTPRTARTCSATLAAGRSGVRLSTYGNRTTSGRHPCGGPHSVTIRQPSGIEESRPASLTAADSSANHDSTTVAPARSAPSASPHATRTPSSPAVALRALAAISGSESIPTAPAAPNSDTAMSRPRPSPHPRW